MPLFNPYFTATSLLLADQSGAEVAVVGICVYGDALEKPAVVLTYGNELLGLFKLGEL